MRIKQGTWDARGTATLVPRIMHEKTILNGSLLNSQQERVHCTYASTLPLPYHFFPLPSLMAAVVMEAVTVVTVTEAHHTHRWELGEDPAVDPSTGVADDAVVVVEVTWVDNPSRGQIPP